MTDLLIILRENVFTLLLNLLFGGGGAWFVSCFANRLGLIDAPSERSSHIMPTPKGGGMGILGAFILSCLILGINPFFYLPALFLSLLSLLGDRSHISPIMRLFLQSIASFVIVFCLPSSPFFVGLGALAHGHNLLILVLGGILTSVFIVGTTNFYNFMDGINGIAGLTGMIGFGLLASYGTFYHKDYDFVILSAGLAAACLGFLPFNMPRAKVFMGDVGSILLGFIFASVVINFAGSFTEFLVLSSFLFPFYADELATMLERIRDGQSLILPHRRHLYQVLANEMGIAHWRVSLGYGVSQLIVGLGAWLASKFGMMPLVGTLVVASLLFIWINFKLKNYILQVGVI